MKKILGFLVATIVIISVTTFSFASTNLTDIKGTKYESAVENLVFFKIVNGYEDKTFKPAGKVTRAELSKMLVLALGQEEKVESAKKKFLDFSDVLSSHWAYGHIKVASDAALVNGYTDGTFKPEGSVTYAEATAMVIRALGYDDAVKKNGLAWPNNYMSYADEKLELFDSMGEFKANDVANRGDIALLIWNALRTGVADIVGENNKGLIYGEGTPMITEYLGYVYIEDAEISTIKFDDDYENATINFIDKEKNKQTVIVKAEDALDMFGHKVTLLIDKDSDEIIESKYDSEYKVINAEITRISDTKIYVSNRSSGYNIPHEDNILLFGINNLQEAVDITLLIDGNTVEYCIAKGASDVHVGVVIDDYIKIDDDEYGVKVRDLDVDRGGKTYYLANDENWPDEDDIILYYINSDDLLVELKHVNPSAALGISKKDNESIKLSNKKEYDLKDENNYSIIFVERSGLESKKLSDIDVKLDKVVVTQYNRHTYIFVFEDAVLDSLDEEVVIALEDLDYYIECALECDESKYSQDSFNKLMKAVEDGKKIDHTYSLSKIQNAVKKLESAIKNLDDGISKTEKKIVTAKKSLRAVVNEECPQIIADKYEYTDKSYDSFYDMYKEALNILALDDATYSEIDDIYNVLTEAIDELEYED